MKYAGELGQDYGSFAKSPEESLQKKPPEEGGLAMYNKPLLGLGIETEMMQIYNVLLDEGKY